MNHECPDSQHLATFVSQTLSPSDEANVGEHIASCVECSNLVARLRKQLPATLPDPTERDSPHPSNVRWDRVESGSQSFDLGHLGRFRLLKILGVGGMGYVFEAEDLKLERRVALKAMKPELARKQKARRRFLREARSVAAVTSDHIVAIHEVDENEDVPFLVMDLLKGRNLGSRLKSGTPDVMETLRIIREAATGLHAAHELGIIHRDIKPSNLWLEAGDDRVKVLDFGLALPVGVESDLTATDTMLGTPRYMSPEQVRGEELDARSDLFSLGSVMYELCSGTAAFPASNLRDTLFRITDTEPKSLGEIDPEIPLAVERIVQKLMAKNRDERFASAKELIGEINEVEYGLRTAVTSMYRRPISAGSESRSSRSSMLPSALCLVVVVVMVMAGLWQPWLVDAFSRNPSIDNPAPEKSTVDGADKVKGPIKPPRKKPPVIQVVSEFKHRGPVRAGAASPVDQTQVLSGDTDGSLLLWDIRNGAVIRDFGHREVPVHSVTFSESGKLVLVIDMLWKVQLVDARSGGMVAEFKIAIPGDGKSAAVTCVAFLPGEKRFLVGTRTGQVLVVGIDGQVESVHSMHSEKLTCIDVSADGQTIATGDENNLVRVWTLADGKTIQEFNHGGSVTCLRIDPSTNGERVFSGGFGQRIYRWDNADFGRLLRSFSGHDSEVRCLAVSRDAKRLLSGYQDGAVILWDVETGARLVKFDGHTDVVWNVGFTNHERHAVSTSQDHTCRLWKLPE